MDLHHVGNGKSFLSAEQLVPLQSLQATSPSGALSGRYRQVKTMDIINLFAVQGWLPVMAQEQRVNNEDREGFQKHMIRFRHTDQAVTRNVGDVFPEIIMRNSHDGTTTYQLMAGLFRLACLNGMIVSEGEFGMIRIKHVGFSPMEIKKASKHFAEGLPQIMNKVNDYKRIELSRPEQEVFAQSAMLMKVNPPTKEDGSPDVIMMKKDRGVFQIDKREYDIPKLLSAYRSEDQNPTLWNTYNIVQEKLTHGNKFERNTKKWGMKKVRGITGIDENIRVNRGLWHLMAEMARIKSSGWSPKNHTNFSN